jgi:hypothetical protein
MTRERPISVSVIAFFNIFLGGVALICCGACLGPSPERGTRFGRADEEQPKVDADQDKERAEVLEAMAKRRDLIDKQDAETPRWRLNWDIVVEIMRFAFPILMIVSGIGLFMMKSWGRALALLYGGFSIIYTLIQLGIWFSVDVPAIEKIYQQVPVVNQYDENIRNVLLYAPPIYWGLMLIYPVIVLLVMLSQKVSEAFGDVPRKGPPPGEEQSCWAERYTPGS